MTHDLVVPTTAGKISGRRIGTIAAFLGVPFAAPPVGAHWLMAPQPVVPWSGVRDASTYGPTAPQPVRPSTIIPEPLQAGDDYLNLNVFTPTIGGARLPVMIWIHGGGYFGGCNRSPWFDGRHFARDGVVVVAVNYRLGFEGFMLVQGAPANRGMLDWLAALHWVHDNIAAFGGDPDQITLAGQSAGAGACATLLAVPRAQGLFRRAILASGSVGFGGSPELAGNVARRFGRILGVAPEREALASIPGDRLLAAQVAAEVDVPAAAAPDVTVKWFARGLQLQPVVDGDLLPETPEAAIRAGAGRAVPLLVSETAEEFDFLLCGEGTGADDDTLGRGLADLGLVGPDAATYRALHREMPAMAVLGRAVSDRVFRVPAAHVAEWRLTAPAPTFFYEFRWHAKASQEGGMGAHHCLDIPFVFDLLDAAGVTSIAGPHPPQTLADRMHRAWVDFVKTGDAGWPAYLATQRAVMAFDTVSHVVEDPLRAERNLWPAARQRGCGPRGL